MSWFAENAEGGGHMLPGCRKMANIGLFKFKFNWTVVFSFEVVG
jgi:hypothetical protein